MDIERLINKTHKVEVTENPNGLTVTLIPLSEGQTTKSTIWLEPLKRSWFTKPIIYKNQYIIVDADTKDLLEFLHRYISLDEGKFSEVRRMVINRSIKEVEKYLSQR